MKICNKYLKSVISIIFINICILTGSTYAQNQTKYLITYPTTKSEKTFRNEWEGELNIKISHYNKVFNDLSLGISFDYSRFQIDKSKISFLDTKSHHLTPSVLLNYNLKLIEPVYILPIIEIGYSWILYRSKKDSDAVKELDESGISFEPGININYFITRNIGIGVEGSYKIIFEHFGDDSFDEDDTIRYFKIGIGIIFSL